MTSVDPLEEELVATGTVLPPHTNVSICVGVTWWWLSIGDEAELGSAAEVGASLRRAPLDFLALFLKTILGGCSREAFTPSDG